MTTQCKTDWHVNKSVADRLIGNVGEYRATRGRPCPICGGTSWCVHSDQGALCPRSDGVGSVQQCGEFGNLYVFDQAMTRPIPRSNLSRPLPKPDEKSADELHAYFAPMAHQAAVKAPLHRLADTFGVSVETLKSMHVGRLEAYGRQWWSIPERDAAGRIIGLSLRGDDGSKIAMKGSKRGLTYADNWDQGGPIFIVEGASDVAVCSAMGLTAIGRPSNVGGVPFVLDMLGQLKPGRRIVIVGENDEKPDGRWPGKEGAEALLLDLTGKLSDVSIEVAYPPDGRKDIREWYSQQTDPPRERGRTLIRDMPAPEIAFGTSDSSEKVPFGATPQQRNTTIRHKTPESIGRALFTEWPDMACDNIKRKWMSPKSAPGTMLPVAYSCKRCDGCEQTKIHQRIRGLLFGIRTLGGEWYAETIGHDELHARGKYVRTAGGDFRTIRRRDDTYLVIANRPIRKGSEPVENIEEIAIAAVKDAPHDKRKVIGGSRSWPKLQGKPIRQFIDRRLPECKATPEAILSAAERLDLDVDQAGAVGPFADVKQMRTFAKECETLILRHTTSALDPEPREEHSREREDKNAAEFMAT